MSKISLNPKYTNNSGYSWSTTTYNSLEYHISTNKTSSSVSTLQCKFTTPYDNIDIVIEIGSSSENNYDWCYIGKLDDSSPSYNSNYLDRISGLINNGPKFKTVTINVAKAGTHFLIIGYRKDGSGNVGNDCGYFRLVTTEVDSLKHDPYIYCGTKTTVYEEPIKFTRKNISNGQNGQRNWYDYAGTSKDYLWQAAVGDDNSLKIAKISFTTSNDNVTIILKYYIRLYGGSFKVSNLDGDINHLMIYKRGNVSETITKEITVQKAGEHFILIGYDEGSFGAEIYVGFSGTNVVTNVKTLVPERILANNKNIGKVYVGSELIWSKPIHNTISWETLTWDKTNNTYTYNSKGPLKMNYKNFGSSTSSSISLNTSPAEMPNNGQIDNIKFDDGQSGSIQIMPYKIDLSDWDSTYVTNMGSMLYDCGSLTLFGGSNLNVDNVTNMQFMFYNCGALTSLDVSKWNVSKVTNMNSIFYRCGSLTSLDVSKWNVSKVTNMYYMFGSCSSLTSLDVSNWNVDNVTNMANIFYNCGALTSLDVSKWNVSKVTNMTGMFYGCNALTSLDVSKWNVSKVIDTNYMFVGCIKLTSLIDGHESEPNVVALNGLKLNLDLHYSTKLNYESVYALFRGVAIVTTTQTITLPKVMQGKLDADKVKIAKDKGWTIAYE